MLLSVVKLLLQMWVESLLAHHLLVHHLLLLARVHHLLVLARVLLHLHVLILSHYYLAHTYLSRPIQRCAASNTESTCCLGVSTNRTIHLVHLNSFNI